MPRVSTAEKKVREKQEPDLVRVRAIQRGYYEVEEIIEVKQFDGTKKRELGRNNVIRNEGEVFSYDTNDMPAWSSLPKHKQDIREMVKTARGEFALPSWVTIASRRERETVASGHIKTFRDEGNIKKDDDDVL